MLGEGKRTSTAVRPAAGVSWSHSRVEVPFSRVVARSIPRASDGGLPSDEELVRARARAKAGAADALQACARHWLALRLLSTRL